MSLVKFDFGFLARTLQVLPTGHNLPIALNDSLVVVALSMLTISLELGHVL